MREVQEDGDAGYPVITGDYAAAAARWEPTPIVPGVPLVGADADLPKLDPSVVDEELARLEEKAGA